MSTYVTQACIAILLCSAVLLCLSGLPLHGRADGVILTVTIQAANSGGSSSSGSGSAPAGGGSPGGGGGGGAFSAPADVVVPEQIIVRGIAYPGSTVTLLKDGQFVGNTQAGPDALFEIRFTSTTEGTYTFSVWARDIRGVRSSLYPFTVTLSKGVTSVISGVFIPPTISLDKKEVRRGDVITLIGQSSPQSNITLLFHSPIEIIKNAQADMKGLWTYQLDTLALNYGDHNAQARSTASTTVSSFSSTLGFIVGNRNVAAVADAGPLVGDVNNDNRVNLIDFSAMLYWYKRAIPQKGYPPGIDLNGDGKVDLKDFSILAYHWTG